MNAQNNKTVFLEVWGGSAFNWLFSQESNHPTFYHLVVLDYEPRYSQERWLLFS